MTTQAAQSGQGGLPPLEYSDCFLDSPTFREVIVLYEKEMESNYYLVKNLVKQCDSMIQATKGAEKSCVFIDRPTRIKGGELWLVELKGRGGRNRC
jgi:hypothetical protein